MHTMRVYLPGLITNVETGVVSASPRPRRVLYDIVDCNVVIDHALLYSLGAVDLRCQQLEDPDCQPVISYLEQGHLPDDDAAARKIVLESTTFELEDDMLFRLMPDKTLRTVVPCGARRQLFNEVHEGMYGAHQWTEKIHSVLSRHYWWPAMRKDIQEWCRACEVFYQESWILTSRPIDTHPSVWTLGQSRSGRTATTSITQWEPLPRHVHWLPDQVVWGLCHPRSDRPHYCSSAGGRTWRAKHFVVRQRSQLPVKIDGRGVSSAGVRKLTTAAYHPQSDGLVERFHQTVMDMMAKAGLWQDRRSWDTKLPYLLFAYRASVQDSTQASPFKLLYGRDVRLPTTEVLEPPNGQVIDTTEGYLTEFTERMAEALDAARSCIQMWDISFYYYS